MLKNDILELLNEEENNYENIYNQKKKWEKMRRKLFNINDINSENYD